jgi:hypothetical protein
MSLTQTVHLLPTRTPAVLYGCGWHDDDRHERVGAGHGHSPRLAMFALEVVHTKVVKSLEWVTVEQADWGSLTAASEEVWGVMKADLKWTGPLVLTLLEPSYAGDKVGDKGDKPARPCHPPCHPAWTALSACQGVGYSHVHDKCVQNHEVYTLEWVGCPVEACRVGIF